MHLQGRSRPPNRNPTDGETLHPVSSGEARHRRTKCAGGAALRCQLRTREWLKSRTLSKISEQNAFWAYRSTLVNRFFADSLRLSVGSGHEKVIPRTRQDSPLQQCVSAK